ncbi:MAG: DUF305 domain-containing protein [Minisyncoccia bacterium]
MEKNNVFVIVLLTLVIGGGVGYALGRNQDYMPVAGNHLMGNGGMMRDGDMGMEGAMGGMMAGLTGKTGDAFDRAFLSEMVMHHQGAVAMAQAALQHAKHAEITQMAQAIISAQTSEITQMQEWEKSWYGQ